MNDISVEWTLGDHPLELLENVDLVCPSGGVPLSLTLIQEARSRGIPLSNDSQVFLEAAPCPVIGITGSAGKTTTTTLVGRMANAAVEMLASRRVTSCSSCIWMKPSSPQRRRRHWIGGNIGTPLISVVDQMRPE
jgi:UDP-N-acetylmuramoylalanine--D-glutamate ligase